MSDRLSVCLSVCVSVCRHLEEVWLRSNGLDDQTAICLANQIRHNPILTHLNLWHNNITSTGAAALAKVNMMMLMIINTDDMFLFILYFSQSQYHLRPLSRKQTRLTVVCVADAVLCCVVGSASQPDTAGAVAGP